MYGLIFERKAIVPGFGKSPICSAHHDERVRQGIERWMKLYYSCFLDDGVFIPGSDELISRIKWTIFDAWGFSLNLSQNLVSCIFPASNRASFILQNYRWSSVNPFGFSLLLLSIKSYFISFVIDHSRFRQENCHIILTYWGETMITYQVVKALMNLYNISKLVKRIRSFSSPYRYVRVWKSCSNSICPTTARVQDRILTEIKRLGGWYRLPKRMFVGSSIRGRIGIFAALTIGKSDRERVVLKEVVLEKRPALRVYERTLKEDLPAITASSL